MNIVEARSAKAFRIKAGQFLKVTDPEGQQVADLVAFNADDHEEFISSGRSIDYASRLFLTTGDTLYSNRSRPMFKIVGDDVGRHDFTLTPCSADTFRIIYGDEAPAPGCEGNLAKVLNPHGISTDRIPIAFNVFMHVAVDGESGEIKVMPPKSKPGDTILLEAQMDLLVGLTACSAGQSNNFRYKPIGYDVMASA